MPLFTYKIREATGVEVTGQEEAQDRFALAQSFRAQGKMVISVEEVHVRSFDPLRFLNNLIGGVRMRDLIFFANNLSAMLTAGLSLSRALSILERQSKSTVFREAIRALGDDVNHGKTLSVAMEKYPKIFSQLFVSMVRAGEESGGLPSALSVVGGQLDKTYNLQKKIKGAMIYPSVVLSALIIIGILMFVYVVPTLVDTFKDLNVELPLSTQVVVWLSDFLSQHFVVALILIIALITTFTLLLRTRPGNRAFETVLFKIPVIGELVRQTNAARTSRTLASLLASGVDMVQALAITRDVLQNSYYKEVLESSIDRVQKGSPLSASFVDNQNIYPILVGEMVEVGEETGRLGDMLLNVAVFYENEVDSATKNISTIIEPVLMIVIGISVGFFAVSMITPMYSVMTNI